MNYALSFVDVVSNIVESVYQSIAKRTIDYAFHGLYILIGLLPDSTPLFLILHWVS